MCVCMCVCVCVCVFCVLLYDNRNTIKLLVRTCAGGREGAVTGTDAESEMLPGSSRPSEGYWGQLQ